MLVKAKLPYVVVDETYHPDDPSPTLRESTLDAFVMKWHGGKVRIGFLDDDQPVDLKLGTGGFLVGKDGETVLNTVKVSARLLRAAQVCEVRQVVRPGAHPGCGGPAASAVRGLLLRPEAG
jgi:hypothetical protein